MLEKKGQSPMKRSIEIDVAMTGLDKLWEDARKESDGSFDWYLISPLLKNFRRRENTLRMVAMVSVVMEDNM